MYLINEHDGINKYAGLIYFFVYYIIKGFYYMKKIQADGWGGGLKK